MPALIKKFQYAKDNNQSEVVCWGTGKPMREFLYVDDLADACVFALKNWDIGRDDSPRDSSLNKLFWLNVGSGKEISIEKLAEIIADLIGYQGEILWDETKPDGTPRKLLDISKIKHLGWFPKVSLNEGIKRAISDFKKSPIEEVKI